MAEAEVIDFKDLFTGTKSSPTPAPSPEPLDVKPKTRIDVKNAYDLLMKNAASGSKQALIYAAIGAAMTIGSKIVESVTSEAPDITPSDTIAVADNFKKSLEIQQSQVDATWILGGQTKAQTVAIIETGSQISNSIDSLYNPMIWLQNSLVDVSASIDNSSEAFVNVFDGPDGINDRLVELQNVFVDVNNSLNNMKTSLTQGIAAAAKLHVDESKRQFGLDYPQRERLIDKMHLLATTASSRFSTPEERAGSIAALDSISKAFVGLNVSVDAMSKKGDASIPLSKISEGVKMISEKAPPVVTVNVPEAVAPAIPAPVIHVHVPEALAPVVNVAAPTIEAPVVNVAAPSIDMSGVVSKLDLIATAQAKQKDYHEQKIESLTHAKTAQKHTISDLEDIEISPRDAKAAAATQAMAKTKAVNSTKYEDLDFGDLADLALGMISMGSVVPMIEHVMSSSTGEAFTHENPVVSEGL